MSTTVQIALDESSIEILKNVDKIHRDSVINIGLALVAKTGYYKTLTGINSSNDLTDIASLEDLNATPIATTKPKEKETKASSSWDNF